jgi:hypothetical protein
MYSLTINFGPNGSAWAFLFKDKEKATAAFELAMMNQQQSSDVAMTDDFGQTAIIVGDDIHGACLEDLDQVESARIYRSLAEERIKAKFIEAAKNDPVLRHAMQQRPSVLTPGIR